MKTWLLLYPDGTIAEQVLLDHHPCQPPEEGASPPCEWDISRVVEAPRVGDLQIEEFVDGEWRIKLAALKDRALAQVDSERIAALAVDPAKAYARGRKGAEALALIDKMWSGGSAPQTPWLTAEAEATGRPIADVSADVLEAMRLADIEASRIEAAAIAAKRLIRAAETAEDVGQAVENWRSR